MFDKVRRVFWYLLYILKELARDLKRPTNDYVLIKPTVQISPDVVKLIIAYGYNKKGVEFFVLSKKLSLQWNKCTNDFIKTMIKISMNNDKKNHYCKSISALNYQIYKYENIQKQSKLVVPQFGRNKKQINNAFLLQINKVDYNFDENVNYILKFKSDRCIYYCNIKLTMEISYVKCSFKKKYNTSISRDRFKKANVFIEMNTPWDVKISNDLCKTTQNEIKVKNASNLSDSINTCIKKGLLHSFKY